MQKLLRFLELIINANRQARYENTDITMLRKEVAYLESLILKSENPTDEQQAEIAKYRSFIREKVELKKKRAKSIAEMFANCK